MAHLEGRLRKALPRSFRADDPRNALDATGKVSKSHNEDPAKSL